MAIQLIKQNSKFNNLHQHFYIDNLSDLDLIESEYKCQMGDVAELPDGMQYQRHSDDYQGQKWEYWKGGGSGGGGSDLPTVTVEDNGDVLAVVDGAWAKAAPPYTVEKSDRVILEETTLDFTDQGGINVALFNPLYIPNNGEMITVFWGENEYHCQPTTIESSSQIITLFGADFEALLSGNVDWSEFPFIFEIITESGTTITTGAIIAESGNSILASAEASSIIVNPSINFIKAVSEINGLTINEIDSKKVLSKTAKEIIDIYSLSLPISACVKDTSGASYSYTLLSLANIEINYNQSCCYFYFYDLANENMILFGTTDINEYPEYPFKIPFTIDNKTYYHDPGAVSWNTWVNTEDNIDEFAVDSNMVYAANGYIVCNSDGTHAPANTGIGTNTSYITISGDDN